MNQNYSSKNGIRISNNSYSISQKKGLLINVLKGFSLFRPLLFSLLFLFSSSSSIAQVTEFQILMTPQPPTGSYNYDLSFLSSNPCLICKRVCWDFNGTICVHLTPPVLLPYSLPGSNWYPQCTDHVYRIYNTCLPDSIDEIIVVDTNRKYSLEVRKRCGSYTWPPNGTTYSTSGTYTTTYLEPSGDTVDAKLKLTINYGSSNTSSATSCGSYTWNGMTYFNSGTYTHTSINASGCTDTSILILTINQAINDTTNATFCTPYFWTENGATYTSSGTYTFTELNTSGCTDTHTLILTESCSSVPTISEWGLFILTLVFAALGMIFIYQRNEFPKPSVNKKA